MAVGFTSSTCCDGVVEWCDTCGGRSGPLIGTAGCRGSVWADDVARQLGVARAWPECGAKALEIAIHKVLDLTRDARAHDWTRASLSQTRGETRTGAGGNRVSRVPFARAAPATCAGWGFETSVEIVSIPFAHRMILSRFRGRFEQRIRAEVDQDCWTVAEKGGAVNSKSGRMSTR